MLGLFASICIFTILHSSEDLLLSFLKETLLPTTDQDPRMELPVAGVIKCTINYQLEYQEHYGDGWIRLSLKGSWLFVIFAAPCWRVMRDVSYVGQGAVGERICMQ